MAILKHLVGGVLRMQPLSVPCKVVFWINNAPFDRASRLLWIRRFGDTRELAIEYMSPFQKASRIRTLKKCEGEVSSGR
jgi:hypothetical protein